MKLRKSCNGKNTTFWVKQGSLKHQEGERQNDGKKVFPKSGCLEVPCQNNTYKTGNLPTKALTVFEVFLTDFHGFSRPSHGFSLFFTIFHAKRVPASVNDTAAAHRPIELPLPRLAKEGSVSVCWRLLFLAVGKVRPPV